MVKSLPAIAGGIRDTGSILVQGRSAGGGHGSPLSTLLENCMGRGAWQTTVHRVLQELDTTKRLDNFSCNK